MDFNLDQTVADVASALQGSLGQSWATVSAFVTQQTTLLAAQAEMIAQSRLNGSLRGNDALFQTFLGNLTAATGGFVRALVAQAVVAIEKAWNAVVGVIWGAIGKALSTVLPLPALPV